ncbi:MAG: hypothetical protein D6815_06040 [Candidatus Dadabacteria bacterium]|nr:MAG: hypothetical protein D6815_06040 [Candidatus Dadabacteria bacterium]
MPEGQRAYAGELGPADSGGQALSKSYRSPLLNRRAHAACCGLVVVCLIASCFVPCGAQAAGNGRAGLLADPPAEQGAGGGAGRGLLAKIERVAAVIVRPATAREGSELFVSRAANPQPLVRVGLCLSGPAPEKARHGRPPAAAVGLGVRLLFQ